MKTIYVGIDPGLTGAVAAIDVDRQLVSIQDTPVISVKRGKGRRSAYLEAQMFAILRNLCDAGGEGNVVVALEAVHAMPKQGVTSMFSLGVGLGLWRMAVAALGLPLLDGAPVEPTVWKREMKVAGGDKGRSVLRALHPFPQAEPHLRRKKDHGRAEALLLAEWARRRCTGNIISPAT